MKKVYLIIASCCLAGAQLSSQASFVWGKAEGKWAYDYGYGIKTDGSGNVYVGGKYEEVNADFSGTLIGCEGNHDGFVVKYNPSGAVQWVRTMGGPDGDYVEALSLAGNHVVVSGEIEFVSGGSNTIKFSNSNITLSAKGDNDMFVAKYDLDGNLLWAAAEGSTTYSEKGLGNAIDKDGNVYVCGYFTNSTQFGGNTYNGAGGRDIYVAKYNSSGQFQWFRHAGSSGRDEAKAAICDAQGNVYICGGFENNCTFGSQTLNTFNNTNVYWDAFLAKYDPDGNLLWVKSGGGDVDDIAWSATVDNSGNIYIGGETAAWAMFGTGSHTVEAKGEAESFIAKYNANGDIQWVRSGGSVKVDRIRGVGTDGTNIFATGQFGGTVDFGGNTATAVDTSDIFITVISPDGVWGFVAAVGGKADGVETLGYESGNAVTGTTQGEVYATGGLLDGGVFGPDSPSGYTKTDAFVTKLTWSGSVSVKETLASGAMRVYPNPSGGTIHVDLAELPAKPATLCLYDCFGQKVMTKPCDGGLQRLDVSGFAAGVYLLQLESGSVKVPATRIVIGN